MTGSIRVFSILILAFSSACRSPLADAWDVAPGPVDNEARRAQIARAESFLRAPASLPTFAHGEVTDCFSSEAERYDIEREDCTYQLPAHRRLYITSERYSIANDTVLLRVELRQVEAQDPLYGYAFVDYGGVVSFEEEGRAFGSLPGRARRVLRRLLDYELGKRAPNPSPQ